MINSRDYSYNSNLYLRESHNCYNYFLNLKSKIAYDNCKLRDYKHKGICRRAQPGYAAGLRLMNKDDYNCNTMIHRTLEDNKNIKIISKNEECGKEYYKGALVVAPKRDFHYYRLNDDGVWTHKPGYKPSTNLDSNNNIIESPDTANRNYGGTLNYKDFCTFLCIPRDNKKKKMKMYREMKLKIEIKEYEKNNINGKIDRQYI